MRCIAFALVCLLAACSDAATHPPMLPSTGEFDARATISSFALRPEAPDLPLGQTSRVEIVARDALGRPIEGTFDSPIVLRASHMTLSRTRITSASDASSLTAAWAPSASGQDGTIVAAYAGRSVAATVHAASGFRYYAAGNDPSTDVTGFQIAIAPNGHVFYGTLGPQTCSGSVCASAQGAIGELDPSTGRAHQIALPSEVLGLFFSSDGALWIAGGTSHLLYRMAPGPLATPAAIIAPPPSGAATWGPRLFAQDASGNVWFGDAGGGRLLHIPLAGPYQESSVVAQAMPNGPSGTPGVAPYTGGMAYGSDGNLYVADFANGVLDRVNPSTGATTAQLILPQQRAIGTKGSTGPRFMATTQSAAFVSMFGVSSGDIGHGALDSYGFGKTISTVKLPAAPAGSIPDSLSIAGSGLYYADIFAGAVGYVDLATGKSRLIPVKPLQSDLPYTPNGIAAANDGTAWFTCKDATTPLQPLCIGHTVYIANWSLFPGPSFSVAEGASRSQIVGIMESPARDSGPFTARSSAPKICAASKIVDHNFVVTGKTNGSCTITVTGAKHVHHSVNVRVIP